MNSFICNKKRISILVAGLIFFLPGTAQQLARVQQLWERRELAAARQQADQYVKAAPGDAKAWLLRARIYQAISKDPLLKNLAADGKMEAYESLEKAVKLDEKLVTGELQQDSFALPRQVYRDYIADGLAALNTAIERDDDALYKEGYNMLKKAGMLHQLLYRQQWLPQDTDTNYLYYTAKAAIYTGKKDEALVHVKKIADAGITQTQANKGFESLYQWLVYYYRVQGNEEALDKYTAIAISKYPHSEYYYLNYIDWLRGQQQYDRLHAKYEELFAGGFDKAKYRYAYLQDLFRELYDMHHNDGGRTQQLLEQQLTAYVAQNPAEVYGKLLFGKYYINHAANLQKEQPVDKSRIAAALRSSNIYLQEIADHFTTTDRAVYNEAVQLLVKNLVALKQPGLARKYRGKLKLNRIQRN